VTLHVYSGPTLPAARVREIAPDAVHHPPVGHGDLLALGLRAGDTVLIIDGLWHQSAPVRHKEILMLLDAGVAVVGAASMGAIRAAELHPFGMLGFGRIWKAFATSETNADDEVAVLHTPDGHALTEALVNLRHAIHGTLLARKISAAEASTLEELARRLPYTRRTWAALHRAAAHIGLTEAIGNVDAWRLEHDYDLKVADAEEALRFVSSSRFSSYRPVADSWRTKPWRTSFVTTWNRLYAPAGQPEAPALPFSALLQHQQLYSPNFPQRWRARVLASIARLPADTPTGELEDAALNAAAAHGVHARALTAGQLAHWLTEQEISALGDAEMLLRIMVRSACWDSAWDVWPASLADADQLLTNTQATATAVDWSLVLNAAVEADNPQHTVTRIAPHRLAQHIAASWGLADEDDPARTAAARDRGFRTFTDAANTARSFYLGQCGRIPDDAYAP
jgi:hypothetical protein